MGTKRIDSFLIEKQIIKIPLIWVCILLGHSGLSVNNIWKLIPIFILTVGCADWLMRKIDLSSTLKVTFKMSTSRSLWFHSLLGYSPSLLLPRTLCLGDTRNISDQSPVWNAIFSFFFFKSDTYIQVTIQKRRKICLS